MSNKIESFIARYVSVHMEGNPQLKLTRFTGPITYTCFKCEGRYPTLHQVRFISGLTAYVCNQCLQDYKKRNLIKRILGKKS